MKRPHRFIAWLFIGTFLTATGLIFFVIQSAEISSAQFVVTTDITPPPSVTTLYAGPALSPSGQTIAHLNWSNDTASSADVQGYHIWRQQVYPSGANVIIADIPRSQYVAYDAATGYRYIFDDVGFNPNAGYYYRVTAYDGAHNESFQFNAHFVTLLTTASSPSSCGNGVVDAGEQCDGWALNNRCSDIGQGFTGGTLFCSGCQYDTQACIGTAGSISCTEWWVCDAWSSCKNGSISRTCADRHFCGTTNSQPILTGTCVSNTTTQQCGNGTIESGEQCDGSNLSGASCASKGFTGGALVCSTACQYDTSACTSCAEQWSCNSWSVCANGQQTRTCTDANKCGTTIAKPAVSQSCTTTAPKCGDGIVQSGEQCDSTSFGGKSCVNLGQGFLGGTLACSSSCQLNTSQCIFTTNTITPTSTVTRTTPFCGNGIAEGAEACDGSDVRGFSCLRFKFTGGNLRCAFDCLHFDPNSCTGGVVLQPPPIPAPATNSNPLPPVNPVTTPGVTPVPVTNIVPPVSQYPISTTTFNPTPTNEEVLTSTALLEKIALKSDIDRRCKEAGVLNPALCTIYLSYELNNECIRAGITTLEACEVRLRRQYVDPLCRTMNSVDQNRCDTTIFDTYRTRVNCGPISDDTCKSLVASRLLGHVVAAAKNQETLSTAFPGVSTAATTVGALNAIQAQSPALGSLPVVSENSQNVTLRSSGALIDVSSKIRLEVATPFIMFLDDDHDGVPNDLETDFGTDPGNADTDNDSITDLVELQTRTDPTMAGATPLERIFVPVEQAIIDAPQIQQPLVQGAINEQFKVERVDTKIETGYTTLAGTAAPSSLVLIYIYSQMPLVLTVKTDANGNWSYILDENLADGKHIAYVAVTDSTGMVTEKSQPLSFFVSKAQARSVSSFLQDQAVQDQRSSALSIYVQIGLAIIILGFIVFVFFILRKVQHVPQ